MELALAQRTRDQDGLFPSGVTCVLEDFTRFGSQGRLVRNPR